MTENQKDITALIFGDAEQILKAIDQKSNQPVFSTSFGKEDQVITHLIASLGLDITIFTLDTGRLFEETYAVFDRTVKKYKMQIETFYPQREAVEALVSEAGPYSFYESVEARKKCCGIRKIEPLRRALKGKDVWITGLRKEQSANREQMKPIEWDQTNQIVKVHPLFNWTEEELDDYIDKHTIPINTLHAKGFPSIGCSPCTRAVLPGEDSRAGRWWWENSKKECGLHQTK
jgi:phosphoadenosine phosphosulfate reductase